MKSNAALLLLCLALAGCATAAPGLDIRDFGAVADGATNNQQAIQTAVDRASAMGGGTVVVPPGTWFSGRIVLKGNVTLRLDRGATLLASTKREDYVPKGDSHFLYANDARNIAVEGSGTIDGQTVGDYGFFKPDMKRPSFRVGLLLFEDCRDIAIRGVTFKHSDAWTVHLRRCEDVEIDRVTIRNDYRRLNSDGIDPNSCKRVRITNCDIYAGDDCIVLKSTGNEVCEDISVKNCRLETSCAAIKFGTESHGDFRNVRFEDCTIVNTLFGIGFFIKDGANVENVSFRNITIETCGTDHPLAARITPIFMDIEKRHKNSRIGSIKNVTFDDIEITTGANVLIQGMRESPIENVKLRNIRITVKDPHDFSKRHKPIGGSRSTGDERDTLFAQMPAYVAVGYVKGLEVDGVTVKIADEDFTKYPRSAFAARFVEGGAVRNIRREPADGPLSATDVQNCKRVDVEP